MNVNEIKNKVDYLTVLADLEVRIRMSRKMDEEKRQQLLEVIHEHKKSTEWSVKGCLLDTHPESEVEIPSVEQSPKYNIGIIVPAVILLVWFVVASIAFMI